MRDPNQSGRAMGQSPQSPAISTIGYGLGKWHFVYGDSLPRADVRLHRCRGGTARQSRHKAHESLRQFNEPHERLKWALCTASIANSSAHRRVRLSDCCVTRTCFRRRAILDPRQQVGYLPDDPKIAVLSSDVPLTGKFSVGDYTADIGPDQVPGGPSRTTTVSTSRTVRGPGRYRIKFAEVESPEFAIGPDAYKDVPSALLEFMRLQRCGENPITGEKCHQQDGFDTTTGEMVDLVGGWHDAGDRLKHMITTSYCVAALYLADAQDEARHGATW